MSWGRLAPQARRLVIAVAPFLLAAVVYVGFAVRTTTLLQGDQPHYALEAFSVADDGDIDLDDDYRDLALVDKVWDQPTFVPQAYHYYSGGPFVSWHAPGLPFLLAPAARIGGTVEAMQVELALIAAFGAWLLFSILTRLVPGRAWLRWVVWGGFVFALPLLGYANQLFPDLPAAVLVLAVVRLLIARAPTPLAAAVASACAAALPWFHVRFWPVALALELAIVVRLLTVARPRGAGLLIRGAAVLLPLLVSAVVMAAAFQAWYGSPSPTAATHTPAVRLTTPDAGTGSASVASSSTVDVGAAVTVAPDTLYRGLGRSLFSGRSGWLPYVPLAFLGLASALALALRGSRWMAFGVVVCLGYLVQLAVAGTLPGYVIPGRFEVILAPLAAIPLAMAADRVGWLRVVLVPVAAVGIAIGFSGRLHDGALYPPPGNGKPAFGTAWLLKPWPSVTQDQPISVQSATFAHRRMPVGDRVGSSGEYLTVPAGRAGVVARTPPFVAPAGGDQLGVVTLGRDAAPSPSTVVAQATAVVDGTGILRYDVTAGELRADGALRGIPLTVRLATGQRLQLVVRSTGATPLHVGDAQVSAPQLADTGLTSTGSRYPDVPSVLAWVAVLVALAAAIAFSLARGPRAYAAQPCTSA